jgi:hypothetical protein
MEVVHRVTVADPSRVRSALQAAAEYGDYFRLRVMPETGLGGWRPVADLYADRDGSLAALIARAGQRLGTAQARVAASILQQGYAARLWSIVLGAALAGGVLPALDPAELRLRSTPDSLTELLLPWPRGELVQQAVEPATLAGRIHGLVIEQHLRRLAGAIRGSVPLSARILMGNTASALVGTLRVLTLAGADLPATRAVAGHLLAHPDLRGAGTADLTSAPPSFARASCCLYYRVPGGGLCGDCVLLRVRPRPGGPSRH